MLWPNKALCAQAFLSKDVCSVAPHPFPNFLVRGKGHCFDLWMLGKPRVAIDDKADPVGIVRIDGDRIPSPHLRLRWHGRAADGQQREDGD